MNLPPVGAGSAQAKDFRHLRCYGRAYLYSLLKVMLIGPSPIGVTCLCLLTTLPTAQKR